MPALTRLRSLLTVALAALMLCTAALWNGQPLLYPDTPTYLRGAEMGAQRLSGGRLAPWLPTAPANAAAPPGAPPEAAPPPRLTSVEDKVVLAGRSVYYGALLYVAHLAGSLGWAVLAQALCVAGLLHLLVVRLWGLKPATFLGLAAALAVATPLAVFTGLLMPDVFTGLAVLAVATLAVYWERLRPLERAGLAALLLFALASHASHLPLVAALLAVAWALRRWRSGWGGLSLAALAVAAACIAGAVAAEWAFGQAVTRAVGAPPLRLPHPMARLVDMGPGTDFLRRHCPQAGYTACAWVDHFPTPWTDFLFSTDPARGAFALADAATKRRMAGEQLRFVADVVREDPLGVAAGVARDIALQAVWFRVDVWGLGPRELAMYDGRIPPAMFERLRASPGAGTTFYNELATAFTYAGMLAVLALALAWGRVGGPLPGHWRRFATLVVAGVVANAVVCAALASPLDRFQARIVWLLPFLALSALALARAHRPSLGRPQPPAAATTASTPNPLQGATP